MPLRVYQAHLERISDFLYCGQGVWWHREEENIIFHDGDDDPNFRIEGPTMMDFKTNNLQSVSHHLTTCWQKCIEECITLPLKEVNVFDKEGEFIEKRKVFWEDEDQLKDAHPGEYEHVNESNEIMEEAEQTTVVAMIEQPGILDGENKIPISESKDKSCEDMGNSKLKLPAEKVDFQIQPNHNKLSNKSEETKVLKSSIAKMTNYVIGFSRELKEFDKHHLLVKECKNENSRKRCQQLLPSLQSRVKIEHSTAMTFIKNWEEDYLKQYGKLPNNDVLKSCSVYCESYKKFFYGQKLLSQ